MLIDFWEEISGQKEINGGEQSVMFHFPSPHVGEDGGKGGTSRQCFIMPYKTFKLLSGEILHQGN